MQSNNLIPGRAHTPEQKRAMTERLYQAWLLVPDWRLPQLISNATKGRDIFYIEDDSFVEEIEKMAKQWRKE